VYLWFSKLMAKILFKVMDILDQWWITRDYEWTSQIIEETFPFKIIHKTFQIQWVSNRYTHKQCILIKFFFLKTLHPSGIRTCFWCSWNGRDATAPWRFLWILHHFLVRDRTDAAWVIDLQQKNLLPKAIQLFRRFFIPFFRPSFLFPFFRVSATQNLPPSRT
jgi:hypothetical protein